MDTFLLGRLDLAGVHAGVRCDGAGRLPGHQGRSLHHRAFAHELASRVDDGDDRRAFPVAPERAGGT